MTADWFLIVKSLHVTTVTLSLTGFLVRAWWRWSAPHQLERFWVRRLPHVNDTLLLATGLTLAVVGRVSPLAQPWIAAKLSALLIYIVLGSIALRRGRTPRSRLVAFVAATAVFFYIVAVAMTRQPAPWA
jgi:uncharacterized membrane protein SirB2